MLLRVASALVLVPAVLALVYLAPPPVYLIILGLLGTLCLSEYHGLARAMKLAPAPWIGYLGLWVLLLGLTVQIPEGILVAGILILSMVSALGRALPLQDRALGMMSSLFAIFLLGFSLHSALRIRFSFGDQRGLEWTLWLLGVVWAGDIAALLVGRAIGRRPLAPRVSPHKTWEGALGGLLASIATALLLQRWGIPVLSLSHVATLGAIVSVVSQLGDLSESLLKRAAGIKDTSSLIPGHGGLLDRIDSLLFAWPVLDAYLRWWYSTLPC